jgi:cell wall-associated NlpC family hydrolase
MTGGFSILRKSAIILAALMTLALSSACFSDSTLTIPLDAPKEKAKGDLELKHETLGATKAESEKKYTTQTTAAKQAKEVPIGRVGVVTASKASIRSYPSSKGRVYFTCPKDTYLAILGTHGSWYGVLMIDSSTAWIEQSKVSLLDYQVVSQPGKPNGAGSQVVQTALKYLGIPYRWGGYSFGGLDCSGFVKAVFASNGISLPRVARDQAQTGTAIGWNQLQPGDRLYFACKGGAIDHAGIYMGNGLFIHSSVSRGGVAVDKITSSFYINSLVAARRS